MSALLQANSLKNVSCQILICVVYVCVFVSCYSQGSELVQICALDVAQVSIWGQADLYV